MTTTVQDIILAEDDQDDVYLFNMAVKETTFSIAVRHAEDGEKLFHMLKEQIPDILFLDIQMPCKDGIACIREIRKDRKYDTLPVIMYTSYPFAKNVDSSFEEGANYFMPKSSSFRELVERLKYIFSLDWKTYMHYPSKQNFVLSAP